MTALLASAGLVLLLAALVDVVWTTVAAGSGAGPLTSRLSRSLWLVALRLHSRTAAPTVLTAAGVLIVLSVLVTWIASVLVGWLLIFASADGAVRAASSGAAGDLTDRIYFTGYTVFTLGLGDYVPGEGIWQLATVLATGSGLMLVTLSITYLVPVASAVVQRRQLSSQIAGLGRSGHEIVIRGWNGTDFGSLGQNLSMLVPTLHMVRLQHLTYPVLHFFHSQSRLDAAAIRITSLAHAVELLRHGVSERVRPDEQTLGAVEAALDQFLDTLDGVHISDDAEPVPVADLSAVEEAGVPVDRATYQAAQAHSERRRLLLASYLRDDGWSTGDVPTSIG